MIFGNIVIIGHHMKIVCVGKQNNAPKFFIIQP